MQSDTTHPEQAAGRKFDWAGLRQKAIASVDAKNLPDASNLPALPNAVTEFVEKSVDPEFPIPSLAAIVEKDACLTFELLRHVNSAAYALQTQVRGVQEAITHIGVKSAKVLLITVGMKAAMRASASRLLNQKNLWNESMQKALFARQVARLLRVDEGLAFSGGLLQDYLLPVLTNTYDDQYVQYLDLAAHGGVRLVDWERDTFGWDHAVAGGIVAHHWNLPDDLVCAIFFHHSMDCILTGSEPDMVGLFPVALAALLPDQLKQVPDGIDELLRFDKRCEQIDVFSLCRSVDDEQSDVAGDYEIPCRLHDLVSQASAAVAC